MNTQISKSILQKVKEILQIEEELSSIELLKLLKEYRIRLHPDKFTEEKANKEAEEKFKEIGTVIEELNSYVENEKLHRSAKDMALFEPLYDNITLQDKLEKALDKIKDLEKELVALKETEKNLQKTVDKKQNDELLNEKTELNKLYKPSRSRISSLGFMFFLTTSFAIMLKIEEVSILLKKYSPVSEETINTVIFSTFLFILLVVIKQHIENKILIQKVNEVCSPKFSQEFLKRVIDKKEYEENKSKTFTESEAFSFIYGKETKLKKYLSLLGFSLCNVETSDKLKNYFINSLLSKKLIENSHAKQLDRVFIIKGGGRFYVGEY